MFEKLPETFPKRSMKKPALLSSAAIHLLILALAIVIPIAITPEFSPVKAVSHIYLLPPPPPALGPASAPVDVPVVAKKRPERQAVPETASNPVSVPKKIIEPSNRQTGLIAPTQIPSDIARLSEINFGAIGLIGGVPGGIPGGVPTGVIGGIIGGTAGNPPGVSAPPLPPPPAPPATPLRGPVRVGGDVREPELIKYVAPRYPASAKTVRVQGLVVLEAIVTKHGTVEEVKVISGNPLLVSAAVEAVRQWRYEPTKLNGTPVAVVLTARVRFSLDPAS